jgi:Reverse transcriptase (RNA-dependent DNA polymerase)
LIAIAAFFGFLIEAVDIDLAFLYGKIDYDIYTELPTAMFDAHLVCKLLKSLYGLKQALRIWYETLNKALSAIGL